MADYLNIAGRVRTTANDGISIEAQEIFDNNKGKKQNVINAETDATLAAHDSAIEGFEGGKFVTLVATDADTDIASVFTRLSVTPATDTIYRIANWKHDATTKYNVNYYSEYAATGTTTAELVPISVENKGIDSMPIDGSTNPVMSGGVNKLLVNSIYFSNSKKPVITKGSNNIIHVVFPLATDTSDLRIYDRYGNAIKTRRMAGEEFDIPVLSALILNDEGMSVVSRTAVHDAFVLLENTFDSVGGLLAKYYYFANIGDLYKINYVSAYFSGYKVPVITRSIVNGNIVITMPAASETSDLRIYDKYGNILVIKRMNGEQYTLTYNNALVINDSGEMSIVGRNEIGDSYVLLYNSVAIEGLLAKYCADSVPTKDSGNFVLSTGINKVIANTVYFSGSNKPTFSGSGSSITITLPASNLTCDMRVYDKYGNVLLAKRCSGESFTLTALQALVMNDNNTLEVVSRTSANNRVVLLENLFAAVGGLLSSFYYGQVNKDNYDNHNKRLGLSVYFSGYGKPYITTPNGIGSSFVINITMPPASATCDMRLYNYSGTAVLTKRMAGETFTLTVNQALVIDDQKNMSIVSITSVGDKYILLYNGYTVSGPMSVYYLTNNNASIQNLNPPSIYDELITNLKVGRLHQNLTRKEFFSFLHFSDIHGNSDNVKRLWDFKAAYNSFINDIICGGDIVDNSFVNDNILASYQNIFATIGNHDAWVFEYDADIVERQQPGTTDTWIVKQKPVYDKFIAPYVSNWGVSQPSDAATLGKCYFYKDYTNGSGDTLVKLRLIFLDCMHYGAGEDLVNGVSVQNAWLESVLADAKSNSIPVAIFVHYWPTSTYNIVKCSYSTTDRVGSAYLDSIATDAVQSFVNAGGEFICWLVGHAHHDLLATSVNYPNQVFICIDAATDSRIMGNSYRGANHKAQDCFNIVSFDTEDKLIKIVRVGNDTTRELKSKRKLVYRYTQVGTENPGLVLSE